MRAAAADCIAKIVTNSAVPAAPATCCTVPTTADPWEYRCGGSEPSAMVNSGVNIEREAHAHHHVAEHDRPPRRGQADSVE